MLGSPLWLAGDAPYLQLTRPSQRWGPVTQGCPSTVPQGCRSQSPQPRWLARPLANPHQTEHRGEQMMTFLHSKEKEKQLEEGRLPWGNADKHNQRKEIRSLQWNKVVQGNSHQPESSYQWNGINFTAMSRPLLPEGHHRHQVWASRQTFQDSGQKLPESCSIQTWTRSSLDHLTAVWRVPWANMGKLHFRDKQNFIQKYIKNICYEHKI